MANFIFAPSVHTGGGAELLKQIIRSSSAANFIFLLDERFVTANEDLVSALRHETLSVSFFGRFRNYSLLKLKMKKEDTVLLFNGLPPLFHTLGTTVAFVQNGYLFDLVERRHQRFTARLRLFLEHTMFRVLAHRCSAFVVQRQSLVTSLRLFLSEKNKLAANKPIFAAPFFQRPAKQVTKDKQFDFFYPASGDPHKNHDNLVKAWGLLQSSEKAPSLALTLGKRDKVLIKKLGGEDKLKAMSVTNLGDLDHEAVLNVMAHSKYIIFPSVFETLGLPLLEAKSLSIPIVASERDYVWDVVCPYETFDPESPLSISRAVRRAAADSCLQEKVVSPDIFLSIIMEKKFD